MNVILLLPVFVLLLSGSVESRLCCKNPTGHCGDRKYEHGQKYICTKKGWIPEDCPLRIYLEGVIYRYLDTREFTPCEGNINKCVYSSYWKEYCMNGDYPNVSPIRLPIEFSHNSEDLSEETENQQIVYTYLNRTGPGPNAFDMNTVSQPVLQYTLYSNSYSSRTVCGGFSWTNSGGSVTDYGDTNSPFSLVVPVATQDIATRGYIVEVYGRAGTVIDRLGLGVTNSITGDTRSYSCGSIFGEYIDATPLPQKHGNCFMLSVAGTYGNGGGAYLNTLVFTWQCQK